MSFNNLVPSRDAPQLEGFYGHICAVKMNATMAVSSQSLHTVSHMTKIMIRQRCQPDYGTHALHYIWVQTLVMYGFQYMYMYFLFRYNQADKNIWT